MNEYYHPVFANMQHLWFRSIYYKLTSFHYKKTDALKWKNNGEISFKADYIKTQNKEVDYIHWSKIITLHKLLAIQFLSLYYRFFFFSSFWFRKQKWVQFTQWEINRSMQVHQLWNLSSLSSLKLELSNYIQIPSSPPSLRVHRPAGDGWAYATDCWSIPKKVSGIIFSYL